MNKLKLFLSVFCLALLSATTVRGDYCTPTFTNNPGIGFITSATTTGASVNLSYTTTITSYPNAIRGNRMTVIPGERISLNLKTAYALWGIVNVYVDLDGDGTFSGASEFLGSFGDPHHSNSNEADLANIEVPSFTIPQNLAAQSVVRLRVIISGGTPTQVEAQKRAGGCDTYAEGGYYDFEMEVKSQIITYPVNYEGTLTGGSFVVKRGSEVIASGASLPEGTLLSVVTTVNEGYELASIKVNGTTIVGNTFFLQEASLVEVKIKKTVAGTAFRLPAKEGNTAYQIRFSDIVLGSHQINNISNDNRVRNITFSVWVKASSTVGDLFGYMQKAYYGVNGAFSVYLENGKLGIKNRYWNSGGDCPEQKPDILLNTELGNQWAFITCVVNDAGKKILLYKDGIKIAERALIGNGIGYLVDECILFCGDEGFSGDFDEVQIWNKVLTEAEINESMSGYSGTIPANLIYYYRFDAPVNGIVANKGATACDAGLYRGTLSGIDFKSITIVTNPQLVAGHSLNQCELSYNGALTGGSFEVVDAEGVKVESGSLLNKGSQLTVRVSPEDGYQVLAIKVNGQAIEGASFFLTEDATVVVELTNELFASYTATVGGSVLVEGSITETIENNSTFQVGENIAVSLVCDEGYEVVSFTVNGENKKEELAENVYLISNCTVNLDINVVFALKKYPVSFSAGEKGSILVKNGTQAITSGDIITHGTSLTIYLTPQDGETTVETFTINGIDKKSELVSNALAYTVTEATEIAVTFKKESFTLTLSATEGGSLKVYVEGVEVLSGASIEKGSYLQIVPTPNNGWGLSKLTVNGANVTSGMYEGESWSEVTGSMVIEAEFSINSTLSKQRADSQAVVYDRSSQALKIADYLNAKLFVYDATGKVVCWSELSNESFDVSRLNKGCYIAKAVSSGKSVTLKFVKN